MPTYNYKQISLRYLGNSNLAQKQRQKDIAGMYVEILEGVRGRSSIMRMICQSWLERVRVWKKILTGKTEVCGCVKS